MFRWFRRLVSAVTLVAFAMSGAILVPPAFDAWRILRNWDEPEVSAALQLDGLIPADYAHETERALAENDPELARSILTLAAERRIAMPPDLAARVEEAEAAEPGTFGQILEGAVYGEGDTATGFAAALATDLMVVGDIRDLVRQAAAYPDYDPVVVALAAVGVGLTAATVSSAGAASPVKLGASVLKLARRTGKLSAGLGGDLAELARRAVDGDALGAVLRAARRLDWAETRRAAGSVLRRDARTELVRTGEALGGIAGARGPRAALDTLAAAENTADVARLGRVAEATGPAYRGALRLAKGVARASKVFFEVASWLLAGLAWLVWLAWLGLRVAHRCARLALRVVRFRRLLDRQRVSAVQRRA